MERVRPGNRGSQGGPELPRYMQKPAQQRAVYASSTGAAQGGARRSGGSGGAKGAPQKSGGAAQGGARPRGSGSGGNGKKKYKVTRAERLMRLSIVVFAALVVVIGGILLLNSLDAAPVESDAPPPSLADLNKSGEEYRAGITIAGVDVGGLTVAEAKSKVEQAVSAMMADVSITLSHDDDSWTFLAADLQLQANTQDVLVKAMTASDDRSLAAGAGTSFSVMLTPSREAILNRLYAIAAEANSAPVEPHAVPSLNLEPLEAKFEPKEGRNGLVLNEEATADLVMASIAAGDYQARLTPVFDETKPSMTLEYVMANTKKIASWSTVFRNSSSDEVQQDRCFNIQKAADRINGYVLYPGEEFSFNGWVGPRNKENGWKKANGISGGKEYTLQYGGGICQVSTTLYGAVLRANLEVTDRRSHSIPSSYADKGLDATVDTSGIDFKFKNNTDAPVYIFAYTQKASGSSSKYNMIVSLYGKALPDGISYKPVSEIIETLDPGEAKYKDDSSIPLGYVKEVIVAREGFVADVYLEKYEGEKLVSRDKLYTDKYRGNAGEYLRGTGDRATTKVPEGATVLPGYDPISSAGEQQQQQEQPNTNTEADEIVTAGPPGA